MAATESVATLPLVFDVPAPAQLTPLSQRYALQTTVSARTEALLREAHESPRSSDADEPCV